MVETFAVPENDCNECSQVKVSILGTCMVVCGMHQVLNASPHMDIQFPLPLDAS